MPRDWQARGPAAASRRPTPPRSHTLAAKWTAPSPAPTVGSLGARDRRSRYGRRTRTASRARISWRSGRQPSGRTPSIRRTREWRTSVGTGCGPPRLTRCPVRTSHPPRPDASCQGGGMGSRLTMRETARESQRAPPRVGMLRLLMSCATRIAGPARSSSAIRRACGYSDPLAATRTLGRHDAVRCPAAVRLPAVRVFASSAMTVPTARSSFGRRTCAFPALRCSSQTLRAVNPDVPSPAVGIGHAARRSRLSLPSYCGAGTGRQGHRAPCPPGPWESRRGTTRICPSDRLDEVERTTAVHRGRYDGT